MIKKVLSLLGFTAALALNANAQDFIMTANPVDSTTAGTAVRTPSMESSPTIDLVTYLKNVSSAPYMVSWTFISDTADHPLHWKLTGFCDNANCRTEDGPWYTHTPQQTMTVAPNANCLMEAKVYVPYTAPDGVAIFKVKATTANQTDTIVYIVRKIPTGINLIQVDDKRVSLYPNPAEKKLMVYAEKNLKATHISIMNITGRVQTTANIEPGKEITDIDISSLSAGLYLVKLTDNQNGVITTRKFIRQ